MADVWTPDKPSRGLGDTIAKATALLGIDPCDGCKERQAALNRLIPYRRRQKGLTVPRIVILGYPHSVGGAGPHSWATVRLWRQLGFEVRMLPLERPETSWQARLESIGIITSADKHLRSVGRGEIAVGFCSGKFLARAAELRQRGAKLVWIGCMSYVHPNERKFYRDHGTFDRIVTNSRFQDATLRPVLRSHGCQDAQIVRIPSPFWPDEFTFRPTPRDQRPFTIGRLSRPAGDKYSAGLWQVYSAIHAATDCRARVMAWSPQVQRKCGRPPAWAECLLKGAEPAETFLHSLHAMVHRNGGAKENRPRVCFEAMACGVPVVAENEFGWPELIRHGETGFLASSREEFVDLTVRLARDESLRQQVIRQAREALPGLIDMESIGQQWQELFRSMA